jgi:hypothetical protein
VHWLSCSPSPTAVRIPRIPVRELLHLAVSVFSASRVVAVFDSRRLYWHHHQVELWQAIAAVPSLLGHSHAPWNLEKVCRHSSSVPTHAHPRPPTPTGTAQKQHQVQYLSGDSHDSQSRVASQSTSIFWHRQLLQGEPWPRQSDWRRSCSAVSQKPWMEYGGCAVASQELDNN